MIKDPGMLLDCMAFAVFLVMFLLRNIIGSRLAGINVKFRTALYISRESFIVSLLAIPVLFGAIYLSCVFSHSYDVYFYRVAVSPYDNPITFYLNTLFMVCLITMPTFFTERNAIKAYNGPDERRSGYASFISSVYSVILIVSLIYFMCNVVAKRYF